jgi:hypothetical protein
MPEIGRVGVSAYLSWSFERKEWESRTTKYVMIALAGAAAGQGAALAMTAKWRQA